MTEFDPHDVWEFFQERASVIEFEARLPRLNAESMALKEVVERYGQDAGRMVQRRRENDKK